MNCSLDLDLCPSVAEVEMAVQTFKAKIVRLSPGFRCGDMRGETLLRCALAAVWRAGREFQAKKGVRV